MRIYKLDGLRGIFSLMVLLYHYDAIYLPDYVYEFFVFRQANVFVDFFFVLSGFVITLNYHKKINTNSDFWSFLKKRVVRLYPLLFYTTTLFFLFEYVFNTFFVELLNNPESYGVLLNKLADTLLLSNSTPLFGMSRGMNYPSWSISSEVVSYIVFAIGMLYFVRRSRVFFYVILFVCLIVFIIKENFFLTGEFGFVRGIYSFSVGVFIHRWTKEKRSLPNFIEYLLPFVILAFLFVMHSLEKPMESYYTLLFAPLVFGGTIYVFCNTNGRISRFLESKPLIFLGNISYSLYLNHALLLIIVPRFIFSIIKIEVTDINMLLVVILTLSLTVIYSKVTFDLVEIKFGKYLKGKTKLSKPQNGAKS